MLILALWSGAFWSGVLGAQPGGAPQSDVLSRIAQSLGADLPAETCGPLLPATPHVEGKGARFRQCSRVGKQAELQLTRGAQGQLHFFTYVHSWESASAATATLARMSQMLSSQLGAPQTPNPSCRLWPTDALIVTASLSSDGGVHSRVIVRGADTVNALAC